MYQLNCTKNAYAASCFNLGRLKRTLLLLPVMTDPLAFSWSSGLTRAFLLHPTNHSRRERSGDERR